MALTVTPADGFISRLIQQTHQATSSRASGNHRLTAKQDQASISQEARQATQNAGNQQLESRLLDLYNQKGTSAV